MPSNFNIQKIVRGDVAQLGKLFTAASAGAPGTTLRRNTAEKLWAYAFKAGNMDAALNPSLSKLQTAFLTNTAAADNFYCDTNYPLRLCIECILQRATIWYARDSKTSQNFQDKLTVLIQHTVDWTEASNPESKTAEFHKALNEFTSWTDAEDKRAAMLENRLCETEINHLKMLTAECQVLDAINSSLAGKTLPVSLLSEIPTLLKSELQHFVFAAGITSPFWKLWQRLLPSIAKVFTPGEMNEQQLYRDIPAVLNELERSLKMSPSNPIRYQEFVDTLSQSLMYAIQKKPQECEPLAPLPYPTDRSPDGRSEMQTQVTDAVLQQITSIQQGDWILFSGEENQVIRCKLALKNAESDQLLFVDNTGRKVMIKSSKDFSLCISTGIAKPLVMVKLDDAITKLIQALIELSQQKSAQLEAYLDAEKRKAEAELESQKQAELQKREEIKVLQQRLLEQQIAKRKAAAHKAMSEARALATEKAERNAELEKTQHAERVRQQADSERRKAENAAEKSQREKSAVDQIKSLNVGAWIEINTTAQETLRCKLAVVIGAAGKYIFVDNLGRKVAEYQREQLIQAYIENSLTLLNNGDRFEDQLVKVIRSLRKDIS